MSLNSRSASVIIGIDIGGANLKYATADGESLAVPFPLWKHPKRLAAQLVDDLKRFDGVSKVVATMTGELADCFLDRKEGVRHIVQHLESATDQLGLAPPLFYAVDGRFHPSEFAIDHVDLVAAENWHALASFVAWKITSDGLLIDIGSTTCDIVPFRKGAVATRAQTDFDRLAEGSLVYIGGQRTPVCSIVQQLRWKTKSVPVMREVFATMDDVRLLLGFESPDPDSLQTADGKPRDVQHATNRMARMIGLDHRDVTAETAQCLAAEVHQVARTKIRDAMRGFEPFEHLVISGHAADLIDLPENASVTRLHEELGPDVSRCAPAFAIGRLYAGSIAMAQQ